MQLEAAVEIQKAYSKLTSGQVPFTKKNMCAILVPLRDKYGLTDRQVLAVARNELSLEEIMLLSQTQEESIKTIEDNCVSVVPCKDCKHSYITVGARCCAYGAFYDVAVQDDFFCALAERKEVNEK